MKTYPLEVVPLHDTNADVFLGWFSKGHHEAVTFCEAVLDYGDDLPAKPAVRHEHWRCAWGAGGVDGPYAFYDVVKAGSRGAFPVTVMNR